MKTHLKKLFKVDGMLNGAEYRRILYSGCKRFKIGGGGLPSSRTMTLNIQMEPQWNGIDINGSVKVKVKTEQRVCCKTCKCPIPGAFHLYYGWTILHGRMIKHFQTLDAQKRKSGSKAWITHGDFARPKHSLSSWEELWCGCVWFTALWPRSLTCSQTA